MGQHIENLKNISRRHFLLESGAGLGAIALAGLFTGCNGKATGRAPELVADPMAPKTPHFPGKAKQVIYLHMAGAPSQLELFDFKPELQKLNNQALHPKYRAPQHSVLYHYRYSGNGSGIPGCLLLK